VDANANSDRDDHAAQARMRAPGGQPMIFRTPKPSHGAHPEVRSNNACHRICARSICILGGRKRGQQPQGKANGDMTDSESGDLRGGQPAGWPSDYDRIKLIGKGDTCRVYVGCKRGSQLRVAVKLFMHYPSWIAEERLRGHIPPCPHLIKTLDASKSEAIERSPDPLEADISSTGRHSSPRFLVMELAEGKTLAELVGEVKQGHRSKPTARELLCLATGLLDALHALHDASIIVGDLSVRTIRVSADWQPRIARYRLASIRGKPSELSDGAPVSVESDVLALGSVLFEVADKDKYDAWRRLDRSKPTGLDKTAAELGPLHAFIDALIARETKQVIEARERLNALSESICASTVEAVGAEPVGVASRPSHADESTRAEIPVPAIVEAPRPVPNHALLPSKPAPWRTVNTSYLGLIFALGLGVGAVLGWYAHPKPAPREVTVVQSLTQEPEPAQFESWTDRNHAQDCIGYQLAAFPDDRALSWACDQHLTKDSALKAQANECFAENEHAADLHRQFKERPLLRVVWIVPQHSAAPQTPSTNKPHDPMNPYKTQAVELKGLIYVQKQLNNAPSGPLVQIVLANAGNKLEFGPLIAQKLVEWKQKSARTAPVAALGFLESFAGTGSTIDILDQHGIISIGTILAARYARRYPHFIAVRTTVELEAKAMLAAAANLLKAETKGELLMSFGDILGTPPDDDDAYRQELQAELVRAAKEYAPWLTVIEHVQNADVERFCANHNALWLFLGRWHQLRTDFAQPLKQRCKELTGRDSEPAKRTIADYAAARIFDPGGGIHGDNSIFDGLRYVSGREMKCSLLPEADALCENGSISIYAINGGRGLAMLAEAATILTESSVQDSRDLLAAIRTLSLNREVQIPGVRAAPQETARTSNRPHATATCDATVKQRWNSAKDPCAAPQSLQCVQTVFASSRALSVARESTSGSSDTTTGGLEPYDQDVWVVKYDNNQHNNPKAACRCVHQIVRQRRPAPEQMSFRPLAVETQADCCCF
jgi:serine/threonine protein kinase